MNLTSENKQLIVGIASLILFCLVLAWICAPREVDGYYMGTNDSNSVYAATGCVYAHWTWHSDQRVSCGKMEDMLATLERLNKVGKTVGGK